MARLWSKRSPALIVSRLPTVMASLTNAGGGDEHAARRWRVRSRLTETARPPLSTNLTPVGMIVDSWCSPLSSWPPNLHW